MKRSTPRTRLANQSQSGQLILNGSPIEPSVLENLRSGPPLISSYPVWFQTCRSFNTATTGARIRRPAEVLNLFLMANQRPHGLGSRRVGRWLCPEPSQRHISYLLEKRLNSCEPLVSWRTAVPWAGCWDSGENAEATEAKARPRRNRS